MSDDILSRFHNCGVVRRGSDGTDWPAGDIKNSVVDEIEYLRDEIARLREWQRRVAEGLGFLSRRDGQDGYEVAEPDEIVKAWRDMERLSGATPSDPDASLEMRTVSKPGAVLEVKAAPIPPKIQSMMAEAIREERK